jgi:hypothetical protein
MLRANASGHAAKVGFELRMTTDDRDDFARAARRLYIRFKAQLSARHNLLGREMLFEPQVMPGDAFGIEHYAPSAADLADIDPAVSEGWLAQRMVQPIDPRRDDHQKHAAQGAQHGKNADRAAC